MSRGERLKQVVLAAPEDPDAFYELLAPDIVWDISDSDSPMAGVYHGREAVRDWWRRWVGAFSDWNSEIEQVFEKGDIVVFFAHEHGHGRTSGAWAEMKRANVWTFRGDQVVHFKSFRDRTAALREAGIDPPRIDS